MKNYFQRGWSICLSLFLAVLCILRPMVASSIEDCSTTFSSDIPYSSSSDVSLKSNDLFFRVASAAAAREKINYSKQGRSGTSWINGIFRLALLIGIIASPNESANEEGVHLLQEERYQTASPSYSSTEKTTSVSSSSVFSANSFDQLKDWDPAAEIKYDTIKKRYYSESMKPTGGISVTVAHVWKRTQEDRAAYRAAIDAIGSELAFKDPVLSIHFIKAFERRSILGQPLTQGAVANFFLHQRQKENFDQTIDRTFFEIFSAVPSGYDRIEDLAISAWPSFKERSRRFTGYYQNQQQELSEAELLKRVSTVIRNDYTRREYTEIPLLQDIITSTVFVDESPERPGSINGSLNNSLEEK